jgi:hypothetical protein
MHLETKKPAFRLGENTETGEITYLFKVQNEPPAKVSQKGFDFLVNNGFSMKAHLNNKSKPFAQPRMRKPGEEHPYVLSTAIFVGLKGDIPQGEGVRPADGNWRNCHEDNLILKPKTDTKKYAKAVDDLMTEHFAERDAVKQEQALLKRMRKR